MAITGDRIAPPVIRTTNTRPIAARRLRRKRWIACRVGLCAASVRAIVAAGFRVVLPDLIGYGASSKPEGIDYTLQLFTDTVYDALRQHGIERASLIGGSGLSHEHQRTVLEQATRMRATNEVHCQTSRPITAIHAVSGWLSHSTGRSMRPQAIA